ncbi:prepilin-type N-terminal cleavage/methylation domain-containing protein [Aliivibrio fischeri]|uniref:pilin n=1 Tax=Aliivibrio fischeri TaxID=668 RepID=UPI0012D9F9FD|nr:pilin [Aliivibrio fischeri]MUK90905.1 prepilin-type N-terminal cleavage/methylation domain-containing protein [Aliivibrio fischeri]
MKKRQGQKGFTLIELMIVVAVIGVLSAIAIPQYQNYVKKGALGTALASATALKTNVEDHIAFSNSFPAISAAFGIGTITSTSGAIATGNNTNDIIATITEGSGKNAKITLKRDSNGVWECNNSEHTTIKILGCS